MNDATKARFTKGVLLAWIPFVLLMAPIVVTVFRGLSEQKAIGVGAVIGGISKGLATVGLAAVVTTQVAAIVLLARAFKKESALRNVFSAISLCCSLLLLSFMGVVVWLLIRSRG